MKANGEIEAETRDRAITLASVPGQTRQIALCRSGLWCLNEAGHLFRWCGPDSPEQWARQSVQQSVDNLVESISCFVDGNLHVTLEHEQASVYDAAADVWAKPDVQVALQHQERRSPYDDSAEGLSTGSKHRAPKKPRRFRMSLRTLMLLIALLALVLGPISYFGRCFSIRQAAQILEAQGHTVVYQHEVDQAGNPIANPKSPSPKWVDRWFGEMLFHRPYSVEQHSKRNEGNGEYLLKPVATNSLLGLSPCLKKLKVEKIELENFSCIRDLKQLRDLELFTMNSFLKKPVKLDWIVELPNLRRLDLGGCHNTEGFLQLDRLKHLEALELPHGLENEVEIFQTISKCTQLKELEICFHFDPDSPIAWDFLLGPELETLVISGHVLPPDLIETLAQLTQLQRLELNLDKIPDLNWVSELKFLRVLKLSGDSDFLDFSPLLELRELAELKLPVSGQKFDVAIVEQLPKLEYEHVVLNDATGEYLRGGYPTISDTELNLQLTNAQKIPEEVRIAKLKNVFLSQGISDLERLRGAPVMYLSANGSAISDLSPLSEAPLFEAQLSGTKVTDLSPIVSRELRELEVANTMIPNLDELSKTPLLSELDISGTPIKDLSPLKGTGSSLNSLKAAGTSVEDITPLENAWLNHLDLSGTLVKDLTILNEMRGLSDLDISDTPVVALPEFPTIENLEALKLANTSIQELSFLDRALDLKELDISGTPIGDISGVTEDLRTLKANDTPLKSLPVLRKPRTLLLDRTNVLDEDLSTIYYLAYLDKLSLSGTKIEKLEQISKLKYLRRLDLSKTKVTDVSMLRRLRGLRELDLSGTKVQDISPLANLTCLVVLKLPAGTNYEKALHSKWRNIEKVYVAGQLVFGERE